MNASSEAARTSRVSAPDGQAQRGERQRRRRPGGHATAGSGPSPGPRTARARQHQQADHQRADRRQAGLLDQQPGARDQPAHEPREGVLLALERQRAGGQQQRDEHERDRHRERDRERAERRRRRRSSSVCLHPDRLAHRRRARRRRRSRFSRARRAKRITSSICARAGEPRGRSGPRLAQDLLGALQPEHVELAAQEAVLAARADQARATPAPPSASSLGQRGVGVLDLRLDRVLARTARLTGSSAL